MCYWKREKIIMLYVTEVCPVPKELTYGQVVCYEPQYNVLKYCFNVSRRSKNENYPNKKQG